MKRLKHTMYVYAVVSLLICGTALVVETFFWHGEYPIHLDHAFHFPLFLGMIFYLFLMAIQQRRMPLTDTAAYGLFAIIYNMGVIVLTLHGLLQGIFEISGINIGMISILQFVGWAILFIGLCILCFSIATARGMRRRTSQRRFI